jgi:hypothetical protein
MTREMQRALPSSGKADWVDSGATRLAHDRAEYIMESKSYIADPSRGLHVTHGENRVVQAVQSRRGERHPQHDTGNSWRVLLLITFAYSLSYIDRQLLNLLVDPIRGSLALNDTQFSLIQGAAFVTAYLIAAPVFGRLVDVTSRRNVLIFGVSAWSVCTALCGR